MNKIFLMGRLTREPEFLTAASGHSVARWSIAVDRSYKRQGEQDQADFFRISSFDKAAEFVRDYLHKGTKVVVEGEMRNDNYTDKNTGKMVYGFQVISQRIEFAESKKASQGQAPVQGGMQQAAQPQYQQQMPQQAYQQAPAQQTYQQPQAAQAPQQAAQPQGGSTGAFPGVAPDGGGYSPAGDGFMNIPDGADSDFMPFN